MSIKRKQIEIRAIGPDNEAVLRDLVGLFRAAYGGSFPLQGVYRTEFWRSHIGSRFRSVVATIDNRVVAHLASYPDAENSKHVQICLPVIRPDLSRLLPRLARMAWKIFHKQAVRQDWQMAYFFNMNNVAGFQLLSQDILMTEVIALCPGYLPATCFRARGIRKSLHDRRNLSNRRTDVLVTQRIFPAIQSNQRELYIPGHHLEVLRFLYAPLGLERTFRAGPTEDLAYSIPSDRQAVLEQTFSRTKVRHLFLEPSLLSEPRALDRALEKDNSEITFTFVNLQDPNCPEVCTHLENAGYRFCGAFPLLQGTDHIMYFRSRREELEPSEFRAERAQVLARYVDSYSLSAAQNERQLRDRFARTPAVIDRSPESVVGT